MYEAAEEADSWDEDEDEEDSGDEFDFVAGSDGFPNVVEISFAPSLGRLLTPVDEEEEGVESSAESKSLAPSFPSYLVETSAESKSPIPSFSKYLVAVDKDGGMVADSSRPRTAAFRRRSSVAPSVVSVAENRENEMKLHLRKRQETSPPPDAAAESSPRLDSAASAPNRFLIKRPSTAFSVREENNGTVGRRPDENDGGASYLRRQSVNHASTLTSSFKQTLLGSLRCCCKCRCKSRTTPTSSSSSSS
jgi:hypothetical protein